MTMCYFMLKKLEITADNFTLFLRITKNGFHNKMAKTVSVYLHVSYYKRLLSFSCTTTTSVCMRDKQVLKAEAQTFKCGETEAFHSTSNGAS